MNRTRQAGLWAIVLAVIGLVAFKLLTREREPTAEKELAAARAAKAPAVLLFTGHICPACAEMETLLAELQPDFAPDIRFIVVDYNAPENEGLVETFDLGHLPTLFLLNGAGEQVHKYTDVVEREELVRVLEEQREP